jgi:hypothetical protein
MTQASTSERGWLLITVSTAGAPPALRVQVWRRLRALGALYLQQSVCLLPDRPEITRAVRRLLDRVHRDGGEGRLLKVALTDPAEEQAVIEDFRRERAVEYADLLERLPEFLAELDRERARGRTTYAEVEESEADLHRYQSWLAKIAARDYFDAPGAAEARAAVARCATDLAAFEEDALAAEAPKSTRTPVPGQRHLHVADANDLDA